MDQKKILTLADQPQTSLQLHTNPYIHAATSDSTRKAYRSDIRHYEQAGGRLPASPEDVIRYLLGFAGTLKPVTLSRRLIALRHWHRYQGFSDPTDHPAVQKTLKGIIRTHGKPPQKAPPFSTESLAVLARHLSRINDSAALRDRALILTGFWGAFRRSELVAIRADNCTWHTDHLDILVPRSKTDQESKGAICSVPKAPFPLCPLTAIRVWLDHAGITEGLIFRKIRQSSTTAEALPAQAVNLILKQRAEESGLPEADRLSSHSLRRGLATASSLAGASLPSIMRQGRWKSVKVVMEYIDAADRLRDNAAGKIIQAMDNQ